MHDPEIKGCSLAGGEASDPPENSSPRLRYRVISEPARQIRVIEKSLETLAPGSMFCPRMVGKIYPVGLADILFNRHRIKPDQPAIHIGAFAEIPFAGHIEKPVTCLFIEWLAGCPTDRATWRRPSADYCIVIA
jgi:hypothetical protein